MEFMLKISIENVEIRAELLDTPTAQAIREALPLRGRVSRWGGEAYFTIPVQTALEAGADDVVEPGDLAYWPTGQAFCIFWAATPASRGNEVRAASAVNVFGKIHDELSNLDEILDSAQIRVELL